MVVRHQDRSVRCVSRDARLGGIPPTSPGRKASLPVPASLVVHTPAKLNVYLEVCDRRPDGFHTLETVMVSIGLYDSLLFRRIGTEDVRLTCRHARAPAEAQAATDIPLFNGTDNLVVRAATLLRQRTASRQGVEITLVKRIPIQAGLGGGSSDAAATLIALNQLWNLRLPSPVLHEMAAELGSDVNFFLDSPMAARCRGRGEQVQPFRLPRRLHAVVVCPPSGLATADVFREWSRSAVASSADLVHQGAITQQRCGQPSVSQFVSTMQQQRGMGSDVLPIRNDLEAPARRLNRDVDAALGALRRLSHGPVGMSGSGTACFTLCQTATQSRRLASRLRLSQGGQVFAVTGRA